MKRGADSDGDDGPKRSSKSLSFAVVCSSNQNRSMEVHNVMSQHGFRIRSFGTGQTVRLPGPALDKPNVYEFGNHTYDDIYKDLLAKDQNLYTQNGLLTMLDRNRKIKERPERFQDSKEQFDIIYTVESRVFDQALQALSERGSTTNAPVHVINLDIKDNHEQALRAGKDFLELSFRLEACEDLEDEIEAVLQKFEADTKQTVLHTLCHY
eukprot:m.71966 g.71966  ORF g.71966 m.71966 type:complete len:210 (+) comp14394_c0_seq1:697-1326(+)